MTFSEQHNSHGRYKMSGRWRRPDWISINRLLFMPMIGLFMTRSGRIPAQSPERRHAKSSTTYMNGYMENSPCLGKLLGKKKIWICHEFVFNSANLWLRGIWGKFQPCNETTSTWAWVSCHFQRSFFHDSKGLKEWKRLQPTLMAFPFVEIKARRLFKLEQRPSNHD